VRASGDKLHYALKVSIDDGSEKSLLVAGDALGERNPPFAVSPSPASLALRCLSGSGLQIDAVGHQ
jgi:hypothetical protein